MATEVPMRNDKGDETTAYRGYSWTTLIFCAFPTLLRGDIMLGISVFGVTAALGYICILMDLPTWIASGLVGAVWGAFYNDVHYQSLLKDGYKPVPETATAPQT